MVRTLKNELEFNCQMQIPPESKTIAWMIVHATTLLNLDTVGPDGKEPSERWRGRGHHMGRCVFGERVWYRVGPLTDRTKAEDRMEPGFFVGFRMKSSEYILIANGEATTARTIRRRPVPERWTNPEEIVSTPWDRLGHRQPAAVRPMGERRDRNHEPDEALLPKPPAEAGPPKRVYLKQSDFDAHGLTQGVKSNARRHTSTRSLSDMPCKNGTKLLRGPKGQQRLEEAERRTRDTAGERAAKRIKLQFADRPDPVSSSSASRSDATAGSDAASASNFVARGVAQNACRSRCTSRHRGEGMTSAEPSLVRQKMTRNERNDSARRRRQNWRWKCQTWRRSMTGDEFWTYDATDGSWKTSDTVTQRCSVLVNCVPESSARAAPSGTNWNQHGICAEHKGHKDWDTCANSSAASQTIP